MLAGALPTLDAVAAFTYYIQHYNQGRPFLLAGHSQGSNVLIHLLSGYMKDNPVVSNIIGLVINPITWTRTETEATTAEGLGSIMPDPVTLKFVPVPQYADARVDISKGVLICTSADSNDLYKYTKSFGKGVYHSFDYPFYFFNIRANAQNRANKFMNL